MKARIKWLEEMSFVGIAGSGHAVVMDGPPEAGGRDLGVRPMEMVLLGLGGCTAFDVVDILRKGRHDVRGCEIEVEAERADKPPKVFTRIVLRYVVTGRGLAEAAVQRAINLSAEKYCSVSIMLGKTAEIVHDFRIIEAD